MEIEILYDQDGTLIGIHKVLEINDEFHRILDECPLMELY